MKAPHPHLLAAILAASRVSKRSARALCQAYHFGGGSGDLADVLATIAAHPERAEIERLAAASNPLAPPTDPPHDRFLSAYGETGRLYLVHTQTPRFIAELFDCEDDIPIGGVSFCLADGESVCNISWIDPPPPEPDLVRLRAEMEEAVDRLDERARLEDDGGE